jgi:hypothetical protein
MMGDRYVRCQEISIVLASDLAGKVLGSEVELVPLGGLGGQLLSLFLEELEGIGLVDALALGGRDAVLDPLPQLGAGDFGGGGVLPERGRSVGVRKNEKRRVKGDGKTHMR